MSRLFDDGSNQSLYINQAVLSGVPLAAAIWFNSNDDTVQQQIFWLGDKDVSNNYHSLILNPDTSSNYCRAASYDGSWAEAETTSAWSLNTWQHLCGIWASATDRRVLLNAGSKGTNATSNSPTGFDRTAIGKDASSLDRQFMSGMLAECAVWDLSAWPGATDSDKADNFEKILASLAKGFSPLFFPLGLVAYWDLVRGLNDKKGGYNLTASGTTVAAHPRIIVPMSPYLGKTIDKPLTGTIAAQSAVTGNMVNPIALTGAITAQSEISGALYIPKKYKFNIGANQTDADDDDWKFNVGASQTDKLKFEDVDIIIAGTGSISVEDLTIGVEISDPVSISGAGSLDVLDIGVTNSENLGYILSSAGILMITPGWDAGCNQGSAHDWSNKLPEIVGELVGSGDWERVEPRDMDQNSFTGAGQANAHEFHWYETAHLLPRLVQELGNLVSEQVINCDLYNADRNNAITVTSITNNLGDGIEVSGVPATPFDIESQRSLLFDLTVKTVGDSTIDASYTLHTTVGDYTLYITGSRIVMFPYRPEAPLHEHLLFDTTILEHVDGSEQRIANRQYPRTMFETTYKKGQQFIEMLLFDRQAKVIAYPAWHEPAFLDGAHSSGALTVNVNTTDYANFYVGGYAVVIEDEHTYDALKIESMTATSITFTSGLSFDYSAKAQVMPLLSSYIEASSASLKYATNMQYFNLRVHIDPQINDIADDSAWSVYNGKPFMDGPNLMEGGQLGEALRTKIFVIDNLTGLRTQVTAWDHDKRYSKKGWKTNNRQELWELRQLLYFLKGRQVSFYIPTFWKDLTPTQDMVVSTLTMTIENIGYTVNARQRWPKQVIRVHLSDDSILYRTIQNSSVLSNTEEQLTLDSAWPATYTPDDIKRIEFLEKVRIDIDDITIIHYNALGQAECIVPLKEVEN